MLRRFVKNYIIAPSELEVQQLSKDAVLPRNTEVVVIGIGKACEESLRNLLQKIRVEDVPVNLLLTGTAASSMYSKGSILGFCNEKTDLPTLKRLKSTLREKLPDMGFVPKIVCATQFVTQETAHFHKDSPMVDMESYQFKELIRKLVSHRGDLYNSSAVIKVITDNFDTDMSGWEQRVAEYQDTIYRTQMKWLESVEALSYDVDCAVVPNFPKPGVDFVDVFNLWTDGESLRWSEFCDAKGVSYPLSPEARGFMVAGALRSAVVPVRKAGKLPGDVLRFPAEKEYGRDELEVSLSQIKNIPLSVDCKIHLSIVDDVLATGGTAEAIFKAINGLKFRPETGRSEGKKIVNVSEYKATVTDGYEVVIDSFAFFTELTHLGGRERLEKLAPVHSYIKMTRGL